MPPPDITMVMTPTMILTQRLIPYFNTRDRMIMAIEIFPMIAPTSINWGMDAPVLAEVFATSSAASGDVQRKDVRFQHVDHDHDPQGGEQDFRVDLFQ